MATSRCFSLIGDSNVRRHMNPTNCRDRPLMSGCQLIPCQKLSTLAECLKSVRADSNVCLLSCLTNFLTGSAETGAIAHRVVPIFQDVLAAVNEASLAAPNRSFIISPPMYRHSPLWYRDGLPEVMTKFSEVMAGRRDHVLLMASFSNPVFDDDGVHLSPYSGLEFVLHLFDEASTLLDSVGSSLSEVSSKTSEVSRVLQDRVMAIEQDHRRLNSAFEKKTAEDAELFDFHENLRMEDWFVISGLSRLPSGLSPKEWQVQATKDVLGVLTILMKKEYPIVYVKNNTGRHKDAPAKYFVQMRSLDDCKLIRDTFGSLFIGGDRRPAALKHVSIRNRVTPATLTRVAILRVFGDRYMASNPGAHVKVIGYEPRPMLKLTPPEGSTDDSRIQTYNFVQAIKALPSNFSGSELDQIFREVSPRLYGSLRPLFVVINDDMVKKRSRGRAPTRQKSGQGQAEAEPSNDPEDEIVDESGETAASGSSGRSSGRGSGRGSHRGSNRSQKRGPSPISGGAEKHRK